MSLRSLVATIDTYEKSCHFLDTTVDWQLRASLASDHIAIMDRSFSFNDIRAFATAMEANLESLTLHAAGLTPRTMHVLCLGLNKCVHLSLLVNRTSPNEDG